MMLEFSLFVISLLVITLARTFFSSSLFWFLCGFFFVRLFV